MEYKVSIPVYDEFNYCGKQNIEFYLLMVGLGAAEAYKYKHISLGVFESLHYDMSTIDLIDGIPVVKGLGDCFQGMGMEDIVDAAEWFETLIGESHLRDAIDYLELDCISRLNGAFMSYLLMISPCLMYLIRIVSIISIFLCVSS